MLFQKTDIVHSVADGATEAVDPPTNTGVTKDDCIRNARNELTENNCTQTGIIEAEMHVEEKSNSPPEPMYTEVDSHLLSGRSTRILS